MFTSSVLYVMPIFITLSRSKVIEETLNKMVVANGKILANVLVESIIVLGYNVNIGAEITCINTGKMVFDRAWSAILIDIGENATTNTFERRESKNTPRERLSGLVTELDWPPHSSAFWISE